MDPVQIVYRGSTYTAKYASFNIGAAANSDVVAAVASKCILVTALVLCGDSATISAVTFNSAATAQVPVLQVSIAGPIITPPGFTMYKTVAGEKLNIAVTGAAVSGRIQYIEVAD